MRTTIALPILVWSAASLLAQQYTISTIAGGGALPDSVPAQSVRVPIAGAVAPTGTGDVYFTSGNSVLKVDAKGILTRVAGSGQFGLSGDGGPAMSAQLEWPAGLAVDASGNLFIAENAAHRIRQVSPQGIITIVAGTGSAGYSGDGGAAASAQLNWPTGLALDSAGNLYVADTANHAVRKISTGGTITTVATGLPQAQGVATDASGNLYITDYSTSTDDDGDNVYAGRIVEVAPDGTTATIADVGQGLLSPRGIAVDAAGNLYIADAIAYMVYKISGGGIATAAKYPTVDPNGYYGAQPAGVAVDRAGNLYVSRTGNGSWISRTSPQGDVGYVVGDGNPGSYWGDGGKAGDASLQSPLGVVLDQAGNLYIADTGNSRVRKVSPDGTITTVAGNGIPGHSGDGGPATSAQLKGPAGLALDGAGNLYIADRLDNRIRKVSTDGTITTVAGRGDFNPPLGDGGPATSAALAGPFGVAVDADGNLYIADTSFFLIRKVSPAGIITTVAGRDYFQDGPNDVGFATGLALDAGGNLYIASLATILKLSPNGTLSKVAGSATGVSSGDGGPATSATLQGPFAVALDPGGNLYISGGALSGFALGSGYVREVTTKGTISTIAGNGTIGYSGDGGPATSATFSAASAGVAVGSDGTIYVADVFNNVVRVLRPVGQ